MKVQTNGIVVFRSAAGIIRMPALPGHEPEMTSSASERQKQGTQYPTQNMTDF